MSSSMISPVDEPQTWTATLDLRLGGGQQFSVKGRFKAPSSHSYHLSKRESQGDPKVLLLDIIATKIVEDEVATLTSEVAVDYRAHLLHGTYQEVVVYFQGEEIERIRDVIVLAEERDPRLD